MTQRERQILQLIEANPMISQQELADGLNITRSSVAVHISNLLKKGYIAGKGYVLRSGSYAVVVGGVNVVIGGCSMQKLVAADSNPGFLPSVTMSMGREWRHPVRSWELMRAEFCESRGAQHLRICTLQTTKVKWPWPFPICRSARRSARNIWLQT